MVDYVVNSINDEKGYGVFAKKKIVKGDIILEEEPFVSCQFEWNKTYNYLACDYCLKSLETAEDMAKRLVQNPDYKLPFPEMAPAPINIVYCEKCKAAYCSLKCKEAAYNSFHQIMCPGNKNIDNEAYLDLVDYWRGIHLPPETACISIIVRIFAQYKQAKKQRQVFKHSERVLSEGYKRVETDQSQAARPSIYRSPACFTGEGGDVDR